MPSKTKKSRKNSFSKKEVDTLMSDLQNERRNIMKSSTKKKN